VTEGHRYSLVMWQLGLPYKWLILIS
jgi:hypothetical protein